MVENGFDGLSYKLCSLIIYLELNYTELIYSEIDASYKIIRRHGQYNDIVIFFLFLRAICAFQIKNIRYF